MGTPSQPMRSVLLHVCYALDARKPAGWTTSSQHERTHDTVGSLAFGYAEQYRAARPSPWALPRQLAHCRSVRRLVTNRSVTASRPPFQPTPDNGALRVRISTVGGFRVRISTVGGFRVRIPAVGESRVRVSAVGESQVRISTVGESRVRVSAVGESQVRIPAVGGSQVRISAVWGYFSPPNGQATNPGLPDGRNTNPICPTTCPMDTTRTRNRADGPPNNPSLAPPDWRNSNPSAGAPSDTQGSLAQHLPDSRNSKPNPGAPQAALPRHPTPANARQPGPGAPQAAQRRHPTHTNPSPAQNHMECTRNTARIHLVSSARGRYTGASRARTRLRPTSTRLPAAHGVGTRREPRRTYREGFYV